MFLPTMSRRNERLRNVKQQRSRVSSPARSRPGSGRPRLETVHPGNSERGGVCDGGSRSAPPFRRGPARRSRASAARLRGRVRPTNTCERKPAECVHAVNGVDRLDDHADAEPSCASSSASSTSSLLRIIGTSSSSAPTRLRHRSRRDVSRGRNRIDPADDRAHVGCSRYVGDPRPCPSLTSCPPLLSHVLSVPLPVDDDAVDARRDRACRKSDVLREEEELEIGWLPSGPCAANTTYS